LSLRNQSGKKKLNFAIRINTSLQITKANATTLVKQNTIQNVDINNTLPQKLVGITLGPDSSVIASAKRRSNAYLTNEDLPHMWATIIKKAD
jgi:hypothetical protein